MVVSGMEITFAGRPSRDEMRRATAFHSRLPAAIEVALVAMLAVVVIGFLGDIATALFPGLHLFGLRGPVFVPLLAFAGGLILVPLWQHTMVPRRLPADKDVLMRSGTIGAEGLYFETDRSKVRLSWEAFTAHHSLPDLVLLYVRPSAAHLFPRTFFASDADWQAFRQLVEANVPTVEAAGKAYPLRGTVIMAAIVFAVVLILSFVP